MLVLFWRVGHCGTQWGETNMWEILYTLTDFCQGLSIPVRCSYGCPVWGPLEIESYSILQAHLDKPIMLLVCVVLIVGDMT
jgi:hypothetical protein